MTRGRVHSVQSLGTVDGPGIRYVIFMQGCNLRCGCCHNPDTWESGGGELMSALELVQKACNYKSYFGKEGGVTISGGEPLLQAEFCSEIFSLCHLNGINTCLDTSGNMLTGGIRELLTHTDRVLLDIKYSTDADYRKYVGCSIQKPLEFLEYLSKNNIPTVLRRVIIPGLNDSDEDMRFLKELAQNCGCIEKVELLPFRKICTVKYRQMGIPFPFEKYETPSEQIMIKLDKFLKSTE